MRLGAVVIPATTQLTADDVDDRHRARRGRATSSPTREGAAKLRAPERLGVQARDRRRAPGFATLRRRARGAGRARARARRARAIRCSSTSRRARPRSRSSCCTRTRAIPSATCRRCTGSACAKATCTRTSARRAGPSTRGRASSRRGTPARRIARARLRALLRAAHARGAARARRSTTLCAPPTVWRMLILESLGARPAALRELASAGEPLNPEVIETRAARVGHHDPRRLRPDRDHGAGRQLARAAGEARARWASRCPATTWRCSTARVARPTKARSRSGSSPRPLALMDGYLDDEARTRAVMAGGYYRTGDEARRDEDGYIHFVGRGDDVFKSSDYRISPFELESVLVEHELVAEAAIVPSPDARAARGAEGVRRADAGHRAEPRRLARAIFAFCCASVWRRTSACAGSSSPSCRRRFRGRFAASSCASARRSDGRKVRGRRTSSGSTTPSRAWSSRGARPFAARTATAATGRR